MRIGYSSFAFGVALLIVALYLVILTFAINQRNLLAAVPLWPSNEKGLRPSLEEYIGMKPIEEGQNYSEFTVGTAPKISIDLRFKMLDSHHPNEDPARFISEVDGEHNDTLAFAAAQKIFETFRPAFLYLEVIKISFYWNVNHAYGPIIVASIVIVDPMTNKKARVEVAEKIWVIGELDVSIRDEKILTDLVQKLITATRKQINTFRTERDAIAPALKHLDLLFS